MCEPEVTCADERVEDEWRERAPGRVYVHVLPQAWQQVSACALPVEKQERDVSVRELLGDEIIYDVLFGDSEIRVKTEPTLLLEPDENIGLKI